MLKKHPWIFLLILFLFSVGAWIFFVFLAVNNAPEQIEPDRSSDSIIEAVAKVKRMSVDRGTWGMASALPGIPAKDSRNDIAATPTPNPYLLSNAHRGLKAPGHQPARFPKTCHA